MKYYVVAELNITDPEWIAGYVENVTKLVEKDGGRYLARTAEITLLEGDVEAPNLSVILEFPSKEVAEKFYNDEDYKPYRDARIAGSTGRFLLIAGKDDTGKSTS